MLKYFHILFWASCCFLGSALFAVEEQREKLIGTVDAALDVIYTDCCVDHSAEEKQAKVRSIIEDSYDLNVIIRRAIGRNWKKMTPPEQQEVLELVKKLVLKAYVKGLEGKDRPSIEFGKLVTISAKRMEIQSSVTLDNQTYEVLYRLGRMSSGWQIYDIVAENISVVSNYRQQLDDHFRKGTGAELITRLEELLKQDEINEDTKI